MKKILVLPCAIFLANALLAQSVSVVPLPNYQKQTFGFKSKVTPHFLLPGTQNLGNQQLSQPTQSTIDNMHVAGVGEIKFLYEGNTGNGFSVYNAAPDNMSVLRPDSTFYSAMPVTHIESKKLTPSR